MDNVKIKQNGTGGICWLTTGEDEGQKDESSELYTISNIRFRQNL